MNQFVARSAMLRGLVNGGVRGGGCITSTVLRKEVTAGSVYTMPLRTMSSSSAAVAEKKDEAENNKTAVAKKPEAVGGGGSIESYWGIARPKITREDGTEWPWNCFMPWETYRSDTSIDLTKHHVPKTFLDRVAYRTVKILRWPTDIFFQDIHHQGKELREAPAPLGYH
ncbi:hypothetical protein Tsubulata_038397 [Turnera subulata]|uniref:ubiquinol oxidase (non-electrogenic) n=1 Tax=Turnera subulata TaxID=218843 RepID=A0A9Q0J4S6_9ROSI|nr:hypothetical protein Tsubulata_038397 [Turnera subulata]